MDHDRCGASFRKAMEFFPRHYPEFQYKAFCCHSWILDTWLQSALPPTANMPRLQREVYLYPAGHGFNCDARASYDPASAALARQRTLGHFRKHLG
jgi:hypothetical protein